MPGFAPGFWDQLTDGYDVDDQTMCRVPSFYPGPLRGWEPGALAPAGAPQAKASAPTAATTTQKPYKWKVVKYGKHQGYSRIGGPRVDETARRLMKEGKLKEIESQLNDDVIAEMQVLADGETLGHVGAVNTYDRAILSIGFQQWTLLSGRLQGLIAAAPNAFKLYGIEVSGNYSLKDGKHTVTVPGIKGVADPETLRSQEWANNFYLASLDDGVIAAEIKAALDEISQVTKAIQKRGVPALNSGKGYQLLVAIQENFPGYALKIAKAVDKWYHVDKKGQATQEETLKYLVEQAKVAYGKQQDILNNYLRATGLDK